MVSKILSKKKTEMVYKTVYFGIQYCIPNCVFCEKEYLVVDSFLTNTQPVLYAKQIMAFQIIWLKSSSIIFTERKNLTENFLILFFLP